MVEMGLRSNELIEGHLTEAQEGLWLARCLDPRNPSQNTSQILRFRGALDVELLKAVVQDVLDECDGFRIRVEEREAGPYLTDRGVSAIEVDLVDLTSDETPERSARASIHRDLERPRDPGRDPMVTSTVYRLAPDVHWWYFCAQHLVIDGYGTTLLNTRVLDRLRASFEGGAERTSPFASLRGVLDEDRRYRASSDRESDLDFWRAELGDLPEVRSLKPGEPLASGFHHRARTRLPETVQVRLQDLARSVGGSWPDAAVAAVAAYLGRHTGTDDVVLGVPVMNRLGSASARVPCTVMNVTPVRLRIDEDETSAKLVAHVASELRRARAHGKYRSEVLRRELGFVGGGRRLYGPLVNILPFTPLPGVDGIDSDLEVLGAGPVDDLTVTFRGGGTNAGIALEIDSNPAIYSLSETEAHRERILTFLASFAKESGPLFRVPTLTAPEATRWLDDVNDTDRDIENTTLVELIRRTCAEYPDRIALVSGEDRVTYAELAQRIDECADVLRSNGVESRSIIGVLARRSIDQIVAFLGSMSAGAAYLPLDPEHPAARTRQLVRDACPAVVMVEEGLDSHLPEHTPVVPVRPLRPGPGLRQDPVSAEPVPKPDDPAYVIYTSGSTGTPKGVVIDHRAIVNRLEWMRDRFDFGPDDRILQKTPATFDVSVWELFLPFLCGATLVVAPPGAHRDPAWMGRLIREHSITTAHFVPSMLRPFLDHPSNEGIEIRRVFCSGEALTPALRELFHQTVRGSLHNLYGPTEAAVDVTHWPVPADDRSDPVPIGRPVWNTRTYVLDERLRPVPPGVAGELYLGGRQLASGYLGQPELTADRFVSDPYRAGERMYRTGDLATWREDGALLFNGRADDQVKVRGQRIELGEIESVIADLPGVENAVVCLRDDPPGPERLVAYVTSASGLAVSSDAIRTGVGRRLPDAMVPSTVVPLGELPLTSSGKVNRAALPAPPRTAAGDGPMPGSESERLVAELFQEILGLDGLPGPQADFFSLGGHSLSAIRVLAGIRERCGVDLGPGVLFSQPTVGRLASVLDTSGSSADVRFDEASGLDTRLVLSDGGPHRDRSPLYCIHPAGGISWCYGTLARVLDPPRPVIGIQAAGLHPDRGMPESVDDMAQQYVRAILEHHDRGPVHLLGWSVGGIIAHAMARHLLQVSASLGIVALLDAYPADCWRDEPEPERGAALRALLLIAGEDPDGIDIVSLTRDGVRAKLVEKDHVLGALSDRALDGVVRVVESNNRLVRSHRHERLEGELIHFRAGLDHGDRNLDAKMWDRYASRVEAHVIPTLHAHMTGPAASARIATVLGQRLASRGRR